MGELISSLEGLKKERKLINEIDWEMTPEMAVRMYLEWGNIWAHGDRRHVVRSNKDYSVYFIVNCWASPSYINLIRMSSEEAEDLAKFELPQAFKKPAYKVKGIYALEGELKEWMRKELNAA